MQYSSGEQSPDLSGLVGLTGEAEILVLPDPGEDFESDSSDSKDDPPPTSTLIEFPGVMRRSEPPWRKELSRRVREVQERRAKEAAEEPVPMQNLAPPSPDPVLTQLELVPQLPTPAMNQLVENALRRVERGRNTDVYSSSHAAVAAARIEDAESMPPEAQRNKGRSLKKRSLSVVPSSPAEDDKSPAKPVRPIAEDAALSYLDSHFPLAVPVDSRTHRAGYGRRIASGIFDSIFMALLAAPFAAGIEVADGNWSDARIQGLMISAALAVMVLYLTIFTALRGQTWGMRILSIRAIDIRTGFTPTGGQSIMRALGCVLSIATLGFGLAYALIDPDKRTLPDRFSKTVIVRE